MKPIWKAHSTGTDVADEMYQMITGKDEKERREVQAHSQDFASGGAPIFVLGHQLSAGAPSLPLPWSESL